MEMTITFFIFILGTMVGSFLNVVIYRIPKGESIVLPASKCQSCQTPLRWYHNIPILSWLSLRGKCGFCKEPIAKQYPIVELITGLLFLILYMKLELVWYLPFVVASFAALFVLVMIDFKYMAVPDSINFTALIVALIQPNFPQAIISAIMAAGGLYIVGFFSSLLARRQAMGGADVIVAGTMGALLGFPNFFAALFLSAILAIIPSLLNRQSGVPFVPFLALATFIVYLYDIETTQFLGRLIYG
ncbi:MAG: prepilin peptidase [Sulfurovum sp.]|nr:prepilin peptidase [Sulfurovum sp.]MCB4744810.1 prepilin peptidase [Sulfurovum sp.]MCB4745976.1 prepilin peptidase [Sulfurovum sp.]MCB4748398.1 prepilin peptidase [Sulfurovum sp.]MCB4748785.1 prepilin peptidase [Sulfurovum sp.]